MRMLMAHNTSEFSITCKQLTRKTSLFYLITYSAKAEEC